MNFEYLLNLDLSYNTKENYSINIVLAEQKGLDYHFKWNPTTKDWTHHFSGISPELEEDFPFFQLQIEEKMIKESEQVRKKASNFFEKTCFLQNISADDVKHEKITKKTEKKANSIMFIHRNCRVFFRLREDRSLYSMYISGGNRDDYMELSLPYINEHLPHMHQLVADLLHKNRVRLLF